MGADIIIAVDISTPLFTSDQMENALGVAGQLSNFLTRKNTELQIELLTDRDILVVPNLAQQGDNLLNLVINWPAELERRR